MDKWAPELPALRSVQKRSGKIPKPLKEQPRLLIKNELFWIAYCDLIWKNNPISYQEMLAYSELSNLDKTELLVKINAIEEVLHGNNSSRTSS